VMVRRMDMKNLKEVYGNIPTYTPKPESTECLFTADMLPEAPEEFSTDTLVIKRGFHVFDSVYRADRVTFFGYPDTYRMLGLWALSVLFHPKPSSSVLRLQHRNSDIRSLICEYRHPLSKGSLRPGYNAIPHGVRFFVKPVEKHPWLYEDRNVLPDFWLTNEKDFVLTEEDWASRNAVRGFGSDRAIVRLAELWINLGSETNKTDEVDLECAAGFQGVGYTSAEASFILPGSVPWVVVHDDPPAK
jgi:hypothetical protein